MQKIKCVISGSFRKFFDDIQKSISDFEDFGVIVLSPKKSEAINPTEEFVLLKTDTTHAIKLLEGQHLNAIRESDFLYIYDPDGYTGKSTLMEIGFAIACGKKIYCLEEPNDLVVANFIADIGSPKDISRLI